MALSTYIAPNLVRLIEGAADRSQLFAELATLLGPHVGGIDSDALEEALIERETQRSTSTPEGVAFPHVLLPDVEQTAIALVRVAPPVTFGSHDCDLVFCMVGSAARPWEHVRLLARIARICARERARERLRSCADPASLLEALVAEDERDG